MQIANFRRKNRIKRTTKAEKRVFKNTMRAIGIGSLAGIGGGYLLGRATAPPRITSNSPYTPKGIPELTSHDRGVIGGFFGLPAGYLAGAGGYGAYRYLKQRKKRKKRF